MNPAMRLLSRFAVVAILAVSLASGGSADAVAPTSDDLVLEQLARTIDALEAGDDAAFEDARSELLAGGGWLPGMALRGLDVPDLDRLVLAWLALDSDDPGLLRLAMDVITEERDAIPATAGGEREASDLFRSADEDGLMLLQVIDRRALRIPDSARQILELAPMPGSGRPPPRPVEHDAAVRALAGVLADGPRIDVDNSLPRVTDAEAPISGAQVGPTATTRGDDILTVGLATLVGFGVVATLLRLRRSRREVEMEGIAYTDSLTGLNNRRRFDTDVTGLQRAGTCSTAMLMIDVDNFKDFNDTYGHAAGDTVLREVGDVLGDAIRRDDIAYRYGGEEFCVLMPNTTEHAAAEVAERVRHAIGAHRVDLGAVGPVSVTASVGVAAGPASELPTTVVRADAAMYSAKHAGRNRYAVAQ